MLGFVKSGCGYMSSFLPKPGFKIGVGDTSGYGKRVNANSSILFCSCLIYKKIIVPRANMKMSSETILSIKFMGGISQISSHSHIREAPTGIREILYSRKQRFKPYKFVQKGNIFFKITSITQNNRFVLLEMSRHIFYPMLSFRSTICISKKEILVPGLFYTQGKGIFFLSPKSFIILNIDEFYTGIPLLEIFNDLKSIVY